MAEKKRNNQRTRRRKTAKPSATKTLAELFKQRKLRRDMDFKPDVQKAAWVKTAKLTRLQQLRLARWVLYVLTVFLVSVFFGMTPFSRIGVFGLQTALTLLAAPALYPLVRLIGKVGGEAWKE